MYLVLIESDVFEETAVPCKVVFVFGVAYCC